MRFLFSALAILGLAALTAPVQAAGFIETAIGNTISVTQEGVEARYYYNDNGSVTLADANGGSDTGTWRDDGGKLCTTFAANNGGAETCSEVAGLDASVGGSVSVAGPDGTTLEATFLAGKVPF